MWVACHSCVPTSHVVLRCKSVYFAVVEVHIHVWGGTECGNLRYVDTGTQTHLPFVSVRLLCVAPLLSLWVILLVKVGLLDLSRLLTSRHLLARRVLVRQLSTHWLRLSCVLSCLVLLPIA